MRLMTLDLASRSGVAYGDSDSAPTIEAVRLRGKAETPDVQARNLGCYLRDRFTLGLPDLIVVENYLNPAASKSADATIGALVTHGALCAIAGCYGVRVESVPAATVRRHFIGVSTLAPSRKQPRTAKQMREDRQRINDAVTKRAILLGYLPAGSNDWDRASAAALWDYAVSHFCRRSPAALVMFGEGAQ